MDRHLNTPVSGPENLNHKDDFSNEFLMSVPDMVQEMQIDPGDYYNALPPPAIVTHLEPNIEMYIPKISKNSNRMRFEFPPDIEDSNNTPVRPNEQRI